jgi:opacity protein-like surface antigen
MRKALRWTVAVAVVTLIAPSVASAENFYAAIRGGPGITPDTKDRFEGPREVTEYKIGFTGSGAVGYMFPFGLRTEGEIGFLYAPVKREGGVDVDGSVKSYLLMANAYYDVKLAILGPFKPYVGAGLGGARVNNDHEIFDNRLGVKVDIDESRTAFAYQARGGMIYDVNKWLDLSLGYRYLHIDGSRVHGGGLRPKLGDIDNHSVELGFAVKF